MRRAFIYISLFLVLCLCILGVSKAFNQAIVAFYMPDLVEELVEVFQENDTIYVDGKILSVYLHTSGEKFELDGKEYQYFGGDSQYNELKTGYYRVDKEVDQGAHNLKIAPIKEYKQTYIRTFDKIGKAMMIKTIAVNIATVVIGVVLYLIYESRMNRQRKLEVVL